MKCLRCENSLSKFEDQGVEIDVCDSGCGGIWFDWQEIKKVDEAHEVSQDFLDKLSQTPAKPIDLPERLDCPKCDSMIMVRKFHSFKQKVEFDECPNCGSVWLDAGELTDIHSQFKTDEERQAASRAYVEKLIDGQFEPSPDFRQTKLGQVLKYITPSYYLKS